MKVFFGTAVLLSFVVAAFAEEPQTDHRLGHHPAVVVKRLEAKKGYDYTAQFYPHPAWLWLASEPPRPMVDHPAVMIAKRLKREAAASATATEPTIAAVPNAAADR